MQWTRLRSCVSLCPFSSMVGVFQLWFLLIPLQLLMSRFPLYALLTDAAKALYLRPSPGGGDASQESEFPLACLFLNVSWFSWFSCFVVSCRQELYCSVGCREWLEGTVVCLVAAAIFPCPEAQARSGVGMVPGERLASLSVSWKSLGIHMVESKTRVLAQWWPVAR